jgi:hypothetical protein
MLPQRLCCILRYTADTLALQACSWCWQHINDNLGGVCQGCADPDPYSSHHSAAAAATEAPRHHLQHSSGGLRTRRGSDDYDARATAAAAAGSSAADLEHRRQYHARSFDSEPGYGFGGGGSSGSVSALDSTGSSSGAVGGTGSSSGAAGAPPSSPPVRRYGPTSAPPPRSLTLGGGGERVRAANRRSLQHLRVIQRNLVYVIGLSPGAAAGEAASPRYFGQYGRIAKVCAIAKICKLKLLR